MTDERRQLTDGLRALADFLDAHPAVPMPYYNTLTAFVDSLDEIAKAARCGSWEKNYVTDHFLLTKPFGNHLTLQIATDRKNVCERVVTGTKTLPAQPEREVEVAEWRCKDTSLLATE